MNLTLTRFIFFFLPLASIQLGKYKHRSIDSIVLVRAWKLTFEICCCLWRVNQFLTRRLVKKVCRFEHPSTKSCFLSSCRNNAENRHVISHLFPGFLEGQRYTYNYQSEVITSIPRSSDKALGLRMNSQVHADFFKNTATQITVSCYYFLFFYWICVYCVYFTRSVET